MNQVTVIYTKGDRFSNIEEKVYQTFQNLEIPMIFAWVEEMLY